MIIGPNVDLYYTEMEQTTSGVFFEIGIINGMPGVSC